MQIQIDGHRRRADRYADRTELPSLILSIVMLIAGVRRDLSVCVVTIDGCRGSVLCNGVAVLCDGVIVLCCPVIVRRGKRLRLRHPAQEYARLTTVTKDEWPAVTERGRHVSDGNDRSAGKPDEGPP